MNRQRQRDGIKGTLRKAEGFLELTMLTVIYYVIWRYLIYDGTLFPHYFGNGKYVLCLVYALIAMILIYMCDGFRYGYLKLSDIIISQFVSILLTDIITYFQLCLIANQMIAVWPVMVLFGVSLVVCFCSCYLFTFVYHRMYVPKNMVMIYGNESAVDLKFKMDMRGDKYHVTKILSVDTDKEILRREICAHDAVIINDVPAEVRNDILKYCYANQIRTYVVPKISDIISRGAKDITLFDTPLLLVKGTGLSLSQRFVKRAFDICFCLIALLPAAPIMLLAAAVIWAEDHGPVFYRQERVTKDGKIFRIFKFRSMVVNAESYGTYSGATGNDPRITRVGRFLRASRLDELPQLLNILQGDMSVVGPRPEHRQNTDIYTAEIPEFAYRLKVKGGLTGYAQIYGKYNTSAYDKLRLDLMYIENYSLVLDIKLILMTLQIMLRKESTEGFKEEKK